MAARLRRAVDPQVCVVGYANGSIGYWAPESAYAQGGYEVDTAYLYYGTPPIKKGAFEVVEKRMADLLRDI